ncbi:hypothetical protein D3C80_2052050 [compost metagenome]
MLPGPLQQADADKAGHALTAALANPPSPIDTPRAAVCEECLKLARQKQQPLVPR